MGAGPITIDSAGTGTSPDVLSLTLPTPLTPRLVPHTGVHLEPLPFDQNEFSGMAIGVTNGLNQMKLVVENLLKLGVLPPKAAPVSAGGGVQAYTTFSLDATGGGASPTNPSDNWSIRLGSWIIYFRTSITGYLYGSAIIIKIGATAAETIDNFVALLNGAATNGIQAAWNTQYTLPAYTTRLGGHPATGYFEAYDEEDWEVKVRTKFFGSSGNQIRAELRSGTWTDCSFGSSGTSVYYGGGFTKGYLENGADATYTDPAKGRYRHLYGYVRTEDGALSGLSPEAVTTTADAMEIDISSLVAPDDDNVDFIRVYRNVSKGYKIYRAVDVDEDAATAEDAVPNDLLAYRSPFPEHKFRTYAEGYPPRCRTGLANKGRFFAGGALLSADYTAGTASVTNDSNEVTLADGYSTELWLGRKFRVSGDSVDYLIVRVDAANNKVYLDRNYEGTTAAAASYRVKDARNPWIVYHSESLLPNLLPGANQIKGITGDDPEGLVAFFALKGNVCVLTKTGLWRITGDQQSNFNVYHESEVAGCCGPEAVEVVDGAAWWMSPQGDIYAWTGSGEPANITRPDTGQGETVGISTTVGRLNRKQLSGVFAYYDDESRILKFFSPLDNEMTNRHAIIVDFNRRQFTVDECEDVTCALEVVDGSGVRHVLTGDVHGFISEVEVGLSDGAYGFEPIQTADGSCTTRSITGLSGLPTSGLGLAGIPVYHVSSTGTFTRIKVASNTATAITPVGFITAPSNGDQIVIGGIRWLLETGRYHAGRFRETKGVDGLTVAFKPQSSGQMWVSSATEQDDLANKQEDYEVDLTQSNGRQIVPLLENGHYHKQAIYAIAPHMTPNLLGVELELHVE